MIKMVKRAMLVKAITKELRSILDSKQMMVNGNKRLEKKIVKETIIKYGLPVETCTLEELIEVLDLLVSETINDKMGVELESYAKLESFKNSYMLNDLREELEGIQLVITDSQATAEMCKAVNPEIQIAPSSCLNEVDYFTVTFVVDRTSISLPKVLRNKYNTIGYKTLRKAPVSNRTKVRIM